MAVNFAEIKKTLVYSTASPAMVIQADIGELRLIDQKFEGIESRWKLGAILAGVGALVSVALIWFFAESTAVPTFFAPLCGLLIVVLIVCLIMKKIASRMNVENRRYELVSQLLRLLVKDMDSKSLVKVHLDLGKPNQKSKYSHKGQVRDWKVKYYEDPWLTMQGRLLDGTSFQVAMTELFQYRSKWKRNRRGKSKHKSKTKSATQTRVQLKPKTRRYPNLADFAADAAGAVQLPPGVTTKGVFAAEGGLALKVGLKNHWDVAVPGKSCDGVDGSEMVAMMFLSLYQILNLATQGRKKA